MAASAVYQDLNEFITCPICLELFEGRNPRALPCLHSFCSDCIQDVLDAARRVKRTDDIICPVCQTPSAIPGGNVSTLPAYFISRQIQTIIEQMKTKHSICKSCETTKHQSEVTSYCFQCTLALCKKCKSKHDLRHKNHAQVSVSASTIAYVVCPAHDQYVEAFCIDCSRAVCRTCSFDEHADHTIKDFCPNEDRTNTLDQLFTNHMDLADQQLAKLATIQDDFNKHFDTTGHQLDRHLDDAIKQLKQQHKSFRAELQKKRDEVNQNLEKSKALIQQGKDCVDKLKRQSASWRRPIPAIPEASVTDSQDLMEGIKQQLTSTNATILEPHRLVFVASGHMSLGDLTEEEMKTTTTPKPQRAIPDVSPTNPQCATPDVSPTNPQCATPDVSPTNPQCATPDVNTNQDQHGGTKPKTKPPVATKSTEPELTDRRSLLSCEPVLLWNVKSGAHDIDILPGGDVIAKHGSNGLQVYDKNSGQKIQHPISDICTGVIIRVSVCDDGATVAAVEWRVFAASRLHIYTAVNGGWEHHMYNTCKGPRSMACTGDGHFIVGSDNNSMYKYDTHGQQIWEKKLSFCHQHISTDHKNRILVSKNECVAVYNEDGVEMFSFPAATDQTKLKPRGLCVDHDDNILVADAYSKSVLLYDSRGQFLKKLVDVEEGPYRVALYNDSYMYLAVGAHYGMLTGKLHMYKLQ